MPKKLTTDKFIAKAKTVHGDKYDYSKVEYENRKTRVCIICPIHGEFWQTPDSHLIGCGCSKCSGCTKLDTEKFVQKAKEVHGDKYDYSNVRYKNNHTSVCIICPEHGKFWQRPSGHIFGYGCAKCADVAKSDTNEFVEKAKKVHGDKYDYSKVQYVDNRTKVRITCLEHGDFWQQPILHLRGQACPQCRYDIISQKTLGRAKFKCRKNTIYGYGINDYASGIAPNDKAFKTWCAMLSRCYDENYRVKYPSYKGCSVCEEWKYFSNFKKWFDENYVDGYQLDKDLTKRGNKIYCPQFCAFIPSEINVLMNTRKRCRGKVKSLGVTFNKGKYVASCSRDGRGVHLGVFDKEEEAFDAYKQARESYIKEKATAYYNDGKIPYAVYSTLMSWEVHPYD